MYGTYSLAGASHKNPATFVGCHSQVVEEGRNGRPQLPKGWLVAHIGPTKTVDIRAVIVKVGRWWSNQVGALGRNSSLFDAGNSDGASTFSVAVRRFEVDGCVVGDLGKAHSALSGATLTRGPVAGGQDHLLAGAGRSARAGRSPTS